MYLQEPASLAVDLKHVFDRKLKRSDYINSDKMKELRNYIITLRV